MTTVTAAGSDIFLVVIASPPVRFQAGPAPHRQSGTTRTGATPKVQIESPVTAPPGHRVPTRAHADSGRGPPSRPRVTAALPGRVPRRAAERRFARDPRRTRRA